MGEALKNMKGASQLDQYILDNVLSYVSEGFLKLTCSSKSKQRKGTLRDFIDELKQIYGRELAVKE